MLKLGAKENNKSKWIIKEFTNQEYDFRSLATNYKDLGKA